MTKSRGRYLHAGNRGMPAKVRLVAAEAEDDDVIRIAGIAAVWGSINLNGFGFRRGAFAEALSRGLPKMFAEHSFLRPVGKWTAAEETDIGLELEGELTPGHSLARDYAALIEHGALDGLSVAGFAEDFEEDDEESEGLVITKFDLEEVSLTVLPAETDARLVQALALTNPVSVERLLRRAGASRPEAARLVASLREQALADDPLSAAAEQQRLIGVMRAFLERLKRGG